MWQRVFGVFWGAGAGYALVEFIEMQSIIGVIGTLLMMLCFFCVFMYFGELSRSKRRFRAKEREFEQFQKRVSDEIERDMAKWQ